MTHRSRGARAVAGALALLVVGIASSAAAGLAVNPIFGSDMVLQRGTTVPVFGTGDVGSTVTVEFNGQSLSTVVGAGGRWQVNLVAMPASVAPATLTVVAPGAPPVVLAGVQVGEVWLVSGQSNMDMALGEAADSAADIADAGSHNIRLFLMKGGAGPAGSRWQVATPTTAAAFSAVGYWAGLELARRYGVPVGLVQATHDGTSISAWQTTSGGDGSDYLAMVKAIQPFAVRGVGWYQGESNGGDSAYETKLRDMIAEWRGDWGLPNLPFGIVQLPSSKWTTARLAQLNVSLTVPGTFLVVTHDLPGSNQLHPTTKQPVGLRLAIGARGFVYADPIEYSGPLRAAAPASYVAGNTVVVTFTHPGQGLATADGRPPTTFQIAGARGRFVSATATIVGNTVEVTSSVAAPRKLRYGFSGGANLVGAVDVPVEGGAAIVETLPASLFELTFP